MSYGRSQTLTQKNYCCYQYTVIQSQFKVFLYFLTLCLGDLQFVENQ